MSRLEVPSNNEIEAMSLLDRAEKKATEFTFFGMAGSAASKAEEAAEMCSKAGNLLKIEKKFKESGDAYLKAAQFSLKANERDEAANKYVEASKSYKKVNPENAIQVLIEATEILKEKGRFTSAASHLKQIAEMYESDLIDVEKSLKYYEEAAELYQGEDASGQANQCLLKVGTFASQLNQYDKAVEKFEFVAKSSLQNNLTKFSAKIYFLNAGLCHMCKDIVTARNALERYQDMDPSFSQTRECQLFDKRRTP
jgi:alpha-soluble NSF attachment protein